MSREHHLFSLYSHVFSKHFRELLYGAKLIKLLGMAPSCQYKCLQVVCHSHKVCPWKQLTVQDKTIYERIKHQNQKNVCEYLVIRWCCFEVICAVALFLITKIMYS